MRFNKALALLLSIISVCILFVVPVHASEEPAVAINRIDLEDGSYIIEEVIEINVTQNARATNVKSGVKNATYYTADGLSIFTVSVTGTFEYTGSSSKATSSSATVYIHNANASYISKSAFCSGISAYATGSVSYLGKTLSRSVALSCSATGVLS